MARLHRDAYGVPHLRADSLLDLAHAQGRVTAHDRAWQLEWLRRRALGTTAELVGAPGVDWDVFARRACLVDTARRAQDALDTETRAYVEAYVDGVNAGLAERADDPPPELVALGATARPWEPWTPEATFHAQQVLFAGLGGQLWARWATEVLGAEGVALLSHEGPDSSGSNAWAVGGRRTASGMPIVAGDPHRVIESPGIYQQVRLACEDRGVERDRFDVVGFTFVGVPGVQHFAHAGEVAWAITNGMGEYQDLVEVGPDPDDVLERRTEQVAVRDGDPVEVEVVRTARGLVVEPGLALRDAPTELGDLGFGALLPLLRARSVDDVDDAMDAWVVPVNNVVAADRAGTVRYRLAGRVPARPGGRAGTSGEWLGWIDPPRTEVPADGVVVTANERRGPESDAVGSVFAPPYRGDRIRDLLAGRDGLTVADQVAVHDDSHLATVRALGALVPGAFDDFDGDMRADSQQAARFAAWRSALVRRLMAQPPLARLLDPPPEHRHSSVFAASLDPTARVALGLVTLAEARAPYGLDLPMLAAEALVEVEATHDQTTTWGDTHALAPLHAFDLVARDRPHPAPLPRPGLSGDSDVVRCTGSVPGVSDACSRGSVARYVWDLADRQASGWVVPTGADGDARGPHHHDQLDAWVRGELVPVVTDWDRLTPVDW
ncbi:MAG: penicillin amidase [Nocardioides sp.]|nr:penicillin amidase [Nocardioides sp.]